MKLDAEAIHGRITAHLRSRRCFVVATILEVKGSSPQKPGARMLIHPDSSTEFTIGGGTFEAEVTRDALAGIDSQSPFSREYKLTQPELGMYCQGLVKVWFEPYAPRPQMLIFGGGHVGQALSRIASATDLFTVHVIDDRQQYADRNKHPHADSVIHTDRDFQRDIPVVDQQTYLVIVTRCHATDKLLVQRYADCAAAYIGLIGSEAKIRQFFHELSREGVSEEALNRLHAPIGLPIGGKDPAEVAVSILAEVIQAKNENTKAQRNAASTKLA